MPALKIDHSRNRLELTAHSVMRYQAAQHGFTLVELIMVIVIMGVIGGIVAVFMKSPIDAYFDSARRAALTDVADTTVRRMGRDIRKALPNSLRTPATTPANQCLEFIPTKTGGRYRSEDAAAGTALSFAGADDSFNMLGSNNAWPPEQRIVQGDVIAVYNLGIADADAYNQDNTSAVSGAPVDGAETQIPIASKHFPLASGSNRFHVIPKDEIIVAYRCSGGKLYRTASTSFSSACPTTGAVLADKVSFCSFVYNDSDLQRNALVKITLEFTENNETVSLYHEVHVNNTP